MDSEETQVRARVADAMVVLQFQDRVSQILDTIPPGISTS